MPVPIPSLILPKIARGPIAKRSDAATNPSTKGESLLALNLTRKRSPSPSKRVSNFKSEPISPPISRAPRTIKSVHPCGTAST